MSLTTTTYVEVICDLVSGLADQGFRSVVLMNGHGGNDAALRVAVDRLTNEIRCGAHVAATSYFQVASTGGSPGHAGNFETSLMLALTPELVQLDRRPNDAELVTPLGRTDVARRQDRTARSLGDERRTHRQRPRRVRRNRRTAARRDLGVRWPTSSCGSTARRSHQPADRPAVAPAAQRNPPSETPLVTERWKIRYSPMIGTVAIVRPAKSAPGLLTHLPWNDSRPMGIV